MTSSYNLNIGEKELAKVNQEIFSELGQVCKTAGAILVNTLTTPGYKAAFRKYKKAQANKLLVEEEAQLDRAQKVVSKIDDKIQELKIKEEAARLLQLTDSSEAKLEAKRLAVDNAEEKLDSARALLTLEQEDRVEDQDNTHQLSQLKIIVTEAQAQLVAAQADDGTQALESIKSVNKLDDISKQLVEVEKLRSEIFTSGAAGITEAEFRSFNERKDTFFKATDGDCDQKLPFTTKQGTTGMAVYNYAMALRVDIHKYFSKLQSKVEKLNIEDSPLLVVTCRVKIDDEIGEVVIPVNKPPTTKQKL